MTSGLRSYAHVRSRSLLAVVRPDLSDSLITLFTSNCLVLLWTQFHPRCVCQKIQQREPGSSNILEVEPSELRAGVGKTLR